MDYVHSYEIAERANKSSAQVRRDLISIGFTGSPAHGYSVRDLLEAIQNLFDQRVRKNAALAAWASWDEPFSLTGPFGNREPPIVAAFDTDPATIGSEIAGCRCYSMDDLIRIVSEKSISLSIITVPAESAQQVADLMLLAGISGFLNFAPVPLKMPSWAVAEHIDIVALLEKLAFMTESKWGVRHAED